MSTNQGLYNPERFKSTDADEAFQLIDRYPFATLVSVDKNGEPMVSHLPLTPIQVGNQFELVGHLARANPHCQILNQSKVTAIFHGPHTYITPQWYAENDVPTWNYLTVHTQGHVELIEDVEGIVNCLKILTSHVERHWPSGWEFFIPEDLQGQRMQKGIVAFKIKVENFNFKKKLSQRSSDQDRRGVLQGLSKRTDDNSIEVLSEMKKMYSSEGKRL